MGEKFKIGDIVAFTSADIIYKDRYRIIADKTTPHKSDGLPDRHTIKDFTIVKINVDFAPFIDAWESELRDLSERKFQPN